MTKTPIPKTTTGKGKNYLSTKDGAGMTAAGRTAYNAKNGSNLKAPQPAGGPRKKSFCARSAGQAKMFPEAAKDPNSRLNAARKRWKC